MILGAIGWPLGALLATLALHRVYRAIRRGKHWTDPDNWIYALLFGGAAMADFAAIGILSPLAGGVTAGIMLAVWMAIARPWGKEGAFHLRHGVATATGDLAGDTGGIWRWIMARFGGGKDESAETAAVVAEHMGARMIPPVREDPALGPMPEPAVIASVQAPAPYLDLARYIAQFEPEDDQALTMFMQGCASGGLVIADAWRHFADVCLGGVGLDPAYVAGILEVGDTEGESAAHKAQVHKRFGVIYQTVQEWIAAGRLLPHRARDFLTGDGA